MAQRLGQRLKQRSFSSAADAAFVGLLVVAETAIQRLEAICATQGITHTQYNVLRILRGAQPDGHPRCEVASRLISRAPDVTRLLDRLDRQGLITRSWSAANRRLSVARITRKGLDVLDALDDELGRLRDETLAPLSKADVRQLADLLDRITPDPEP